MRTTIILALGACEWGVGSAVPGSGGSAGVLGMAPKCHKLWWFSAHWPRGRTPLVTLGPPIPLGSFGEPLCPLGFTLGSTQGSLGFSWALSGIHLGSFGDASGLLGGTLGFPWGGLSWALLGIFLTFFEPHSRLSARPPVCAPHNMYTNSRSTAKAAVMLLGNAI